MKKLMRKDADRNRSIVIKKEDIRGAVCSDHQNCVIARAIAREMKAEWVDVGAAVVLVKQKKNSKLLRFMLHEVAREQVRYFDTEGYFAPCEVLLSAPTQTNRLDYRLGRPTGQHTRKYTAKRETLRTR